ncbi:MAG: hypothetical protein IT327_31855 [Anaerolineae bacterium]|jgi:hypothetical protein|nr:hypothetical protein [Anaerolineae bacterium]
MFEVNGVYANRKGEYTVLEINPPKMRVRFTDDGSEAELKIELQARIWENIAAEYEARAASRSARAARRGLSSNANHFIKIISVPAVDEMNFPGWPERVVMAPPADGNIRLQSGDRLIFYALETQTFFAVATITGESIEANPKEYFFTVPVETAEFYPIDIDAVSSKLDKGADIDSVELESQPRFKRLRLEAEAFYSINEDDFELLAEALTEVAEDEEEEEEEEEEYEEEEE